MQNALNGQKCAKKNQKQPKSVKDECKQPKVVYIAKCGPKMAEMAKRLKRPKISHLKETSQKRMEIDLLPKKGPNWPENGHISGHWCEITVK